MRLVLTPGQPRIARYGKPPKTLYPLQTINMNQAPLLVKERKPKTGNGNTAYKTLTAAVKAAEKEKEEAAKHAEKAKLYVELAGNSANLTKMHLEEHCKLIEKHERFLTIWAISCIAFSVAYAIFC